MTNDKQDSVGGRHVGASFLHVLLKIQRDESSSMYIIYYALAAIKKKCIVDNGITCSRLLDIFLQ